MSYAHQIKNSPESQLFEYNLQQALQRLNAEPKNLNLLIMDEDIKFINRLYVKIMYCDAVKYPIIAQNQKTIKEELRRTANNMVDNLVSNKNKDAKIAFYKECKHLPLFSMHHSHGFFATLGRTRSQARFDNEIFQIKYF